MFIVSYLLLFLTTYIILTVIRFFWNRRRLYKLASKIPGHNGYPILGVIPKYLKIDKKDFFDATFQMMDGNSFITKIWVGPKLMLITEDPDVIHTVFNSPNCINKPDLFYHALTVTKGLVPLNGALYHKHRRILNKAFMISTLKKIHPIIDEKCKRMVTKLEENLGVELDILEIIGACALESFGEAQCGYTADLYGAEGLEIIKKSLELGLERITKPWFYFLPKFMFKMTKLSKEIEQVLNFGLKYKLKATEIYNKMKMEDYDSIKHRVIDQLLNPESKLSDIEIRDELMIFTIGSFDTAAKTASIVLLLTAVFPEVQKKLISEIDNICGRDENFTIDMDFLKKFEYMEMVIKETMRLFPAGPSVARTTDQEMEVGGYIIPKDSIFLLSLMRMHRSSKHWGSDAHLFRPERFGDELKNPRAFAPFTGGKRLCIGYRYANMLMKTLLIHFFRSYRVETSLKFEDLKVTQGITLMMDQGYMVKVTKR